MKLQDKQLGECEVEICHGQMSCVDSFIEKGYSVTLDRELTDEECERLQNEWEAEIQMNSWEGGHSRNHNQEKKKMNEEQLKEIEEHAACAWYYPGTSPEGSKRDATKDINQLIAVIRKLQAPREVKPSPLSEEEKQPLD